MLNFINYNKNNKFRIHNLTIIDINTILKINSIKKFKLSNKFIIIILYYFFNIIILSACLTWRFEWPSKNTNLHLNFK